ncbi:Acyl-CoA dehydrogenase [Zhongshania aliphaticivorans]|uniref:Acyl-CoA dehydrogenase n=1 Tax=Zhongshania aliphaticivorans TaxID=1470434 RepID=A0A5S9MZ70_9GAMM|nr:acyl-CoA dehydrogenase family protein [Zhongshania aliphaticivorans]CAA0082532.1 Acyl-CoA dehydrogenase [Zhongshania aliphaticivorans]CAA0084149.1 Acyl-CoA dehydrogenase [Zhongshania aliphaticivorans]
MDFTFSEDQLLFQDSVRDFLINEVTPETIRAGWKAESGRSDALWQQFVDMGLTGITVPEEFGGLGMNELDFVLLAQEAGYVALSEPLVHSALVAVPTILNCGNTAFAEQWLPKIAAGEAKVAVGLAINGLVEDAHIASLLILEKAGSVYVVDPSKADLRHNESVDLGRKLFAVEFDVSAALKLAEGQEAQTLIEFALNRGALAVAAQALGVAQRMIDISVQYTSERKQFGVAIGSFQAVKHHMANIAYKLEYAKTPVYRAAYALANGLPSASHNVSHAKVVACEVADLAAKNSIQVHGAMGYTWEVDLHIFMKRAWALNNSYGTAGFHKQRLAEYVFSGSALLGAGNTFAA